MITICSPSNFKKSVENIINTHNNTCLITHIDPDGDGFCTCLAWKTIFQHYGKEIDFIVDDNNFQKFDFLLPDYNTKLVNENLFYEVVIIIDMHDIYRLGGKKHIWQNSKKVIIMDHHVVDNDLMNCDVAWIDTNYVCTGMMLWEMYKNDIVDYPQDKKEYIAECLYTTLINDSNNFTNSNTNAEAFIMSAELTSIGLKPHITYHKFMDNKTAIETKLLGQILSTIETFEMGTILFIHCTLQMLKENNLELDSTSDVTKFVQNIKGVDTLAFFRENEIGVFKVSLRSKNRNVYKIAIEYGGGGHLRAAGCICRGTLVELKTTFLKKIVSAEFINEN